MPKVTTGVRKSAATPNSFEPNNPGRKNDQALWTEDGIADALDEACGEMGSQIEWGWVCVGAIYVQPNVEIDPQFPVRKLARDENTITLYATILVDEGNVRDFLCAHAISHLPPGTRYELRKKYPTNYGRAHGMCWYRNDAMDKCGGWGGLTAPEARPGYILVGEFTTPGEKPAPPPPPADIVGERE